jgi:NADH:ubiquinone oxidoreductase subunit 6 (subunit J)
VLNFLQLLWRLLTFLVVDVWPITLVMVLGAAAVYYLLPQPRRLRWRRGTVLGALALVLGGVLLVGTHTLSPETVLFYSFSALAIISGCLLVTQHNPARAALSFALVVLSTCGLFLLLAAPFLMAATIIIYAGAIVVTFLFVIMLAQQIGLSSADIRSREPLLATITGFVLLGALIYVIGLSYGTGEIDKLQQRAQKAADQTNATDINRLVVKGADGEDLFRSYKETFLSHGWTDLRDQVEIEEFKWPEANLKDDAATMKGALANLVAIGAQARNRLGCLQPPGNTLMSNLSGPPPAVPLKDLRRDAAGQPVLPAENAAYLGKSLFTDYLLPVELAGTLLLVATVGAIAIAYRRHPTERAS